MLLSIELAYTKNRTDQFKNQVQTQMSQCGKSHASMAHLMQLYNYFSLCCRHWFHDANYNFLGHQDTSQATRAYMVYLLIKSKINVKDGTHGFHTHKYSIMFTKPNITPFSSGALPISNTKNYIWDGLLSKTLLLHRLKKIWPPNLVATEKNICQCLGQWLSCSALCANSR